MSKQTKKKTKEFKNKKLNIKRQSTKNQMETKNENENQKKKFRNSVKFSEWYSVFASCFVSGIKWLHFLLCLFFLLYIVLRGREFCVSFLWCGQKGTQAVFEWISKCFKCFLCMVVVVVISNVVSMSERLREREEIEIGARERKEILNDYELTFQFRT